MIEIRGEIRVEITEVVARLQHALEAGHRVWGGGVSIRQSKTSGCFRLHYVSPNGKAVHRTVRGAREAVWAYLKLVDGAVTAAVSY